MITRASGINSSLPDDLSRASDTSRIVSLPVSFSLDVISLVISYARFIPFFHGFKPRPEKFIDAFSLKIPLVPECFIFPRTFLDLISKFPHAFELPLHAPLRAFRREFAIAFQYAQTVSLLIHTPFLYFRCYGKSRWLFKNLEII